MSRVEEGTLLWEPDTNRRQRSNMNHYMEWLKKNKELHFTNYHSLWKWSTDELEAFWKSLWEYFNIRSLQPYEEIVTTHKMPGAKWFPGAKLNYTEHIFRNRDNSKPAIIHSSESRDTNEVKWAQLYQDTAALQQTLKCIGITKADRVVAYVPNIYEAVVAFLATASLGAIWSSASPDFGTASVIDRFAQIEPKVMITVDGYHYGGKSFKRLATVAKIQSQLPTLEATIVIPFLSKNPNDTMLKNVISWKEAIKKTNTQLSLTYEHVDFNDPLWVLFSSGTTGKPKPIVQSQGGILLEHLKALTFHIDLTEHDRFFWYTTTGWMMWNFLVGGLLTGSTIILYDGNPGYPNQKALWKMAEQTNMTVLGTSASYILNNMKSEQSPINDFNLSHLKSIGSTGSPLPPEAYQWCYEHIKKDVWINSISGGTDVCTAFILGVPILPVYAGEMQCRGLGAKIESYTNDGKPLSNEIGELVITEPLPSMPIFFWGDTDGSRLHESYFDKFSGIWRHGDYLKITNRQTCVIYGRSDATINQGGIRIGTSEIYRAVDGVQEVADSLIVDISDPTGDPAVLLFVVLKKGNKLTGNLQKSIKRQIQIMCSPRHVPTSIYEVGDLPQTLNGKKLEVPVKKILMGQSVENVVVKDSLANPKALDYFIQFAQKQSK